MCGTHTLAALGRNLGNESDGNGGSENNIHHDQRFGECARPYLRNGVAKNTHQGRFMSSNSETYCFSLFVRYIAFRFRLGGFFLTLISRMTFETDLSRNGVLARSSSSAFQEEQQ